MKLKRLLELRMDVGSDVRPCVFLEHVQSGTGKLLPDVLLPDRSASAVGLVAAEPGDLLFGKLRPYLAKTWSVDRPIYVTTELLCLRARSGVDSRWVGYLVASKPVIQWSIATSDGAKMPRTSWEKLGQVEVSAPVVEKQRAIADFLDDETARIDALIAKKLRLVGLIEDRFWGSLRSAALSIGVNYVPLRRALLSIVDGPFGNAFSSSDYRDNGPVVVRLGNIGFAEYRYHDQARVDYDLYQRFISHKVRPGDLLIAGLGDESNHAGRACVAPSDLGEAIVKGKCFCARVDPRKASARYLALVLSSDYGVERIAEVARGSTRAMINLDIVKAMTIPLPDVEVQLRIVGRMTELRTKIDEMRLRLEQQISLLREHRQALITAAVTGEMEVLGVSR